LKQTGSTRQFIERLHAVVTFHKEKPDAWYDGMYLTPNLHVWGRAARKSLVQTAERLASATRAMLTATLLSPGSSASR
jgi:hypothetical protein